jgi:hypothetical protein
LVNLDCPQRPLIDEIALTHRDISDAERKPTLGHEVEESVDPPALFWDSVAAAGADSELLDIDAEFLDVLG